MRNEIGCKLTVCGNLWKEDAVLRLLHYSAKEHLQSGDRYEIRLGLPVDLPPLDTRDIGWVSRPDINLLPLCEFKDWQYMPALGLWLLGRYEVPHA